MLTIPANILTLLKSKVMVGDNRPTAKVSITNAPPAGIQTFTDLRAIRSSGTLKHWQGGSFVHRADKTVLVTYGNNSDDYIYLAIVPNEDAIFYDDDRAGADEWQFVQPTGGVDRGRAIPSRLYKLSDGSILLFVLNPGVFNGGSPTPNISPSITVYRNADAMGEDWDIWGTITEGAINADTVHNFWSNNGIVGVPVTCDSGRILIPWQAACIGDLNLGTDGCFISYSDDNGQTWTTVLIHRSNWSDAVPATFRGIMRFGNTYLAEIQAQNISAKFGLHVSTDEGGTWSTYWAKSTQTYWEGSFWGQDGYNYWLRQTGMMNDWKEFYRRPDTDTPTNGAEVFDVTKWELLKDTTGFMPGQECVWVTEDDKIAVVYTNDSTSPVEQQEVDIWGAIKEKVNIPIKSITVDRSKGSASQSTVVVDNKGGLYAPDPAGDWHHIIWPNNTVDIELGYGKDLQLVFHGLIDELTMRSYPAEIEFVCRDMSKIALDQMIQWVHNGMTYYGISYQNKTLEYIFEDLADRAGFAQITTEVTGITVTDIQFSQESYADAFQRLCEMCGFEWFTDEIGAIYFRKAVEPDPTAAYVFTEGIDIFSLDYRISDAEIYAKVIVVAETDPNEDGDSSTVWAEQDCYMTDYGVLPQKVMYIQANGMASTTQQCADLALTAANAIKPKPREVTFVVVGHPYLQIGDCIQVIESSSTISETYRIFELTHQMQAQGSPVFATTIKCFHYAAA